MCRPYDATSSRLALIGQATTFPSVRRRPCLKRVCFQLVKAGCKLARPDALEPRFSAS